MSATATDSTRIAKVVARPRTPIVGISPSDLYVRMSLSRNVTVIDIRTAEEVHALSIRGTINIPDAKTTAMVHRLAESSSVVLVCADGAASRASCTTLRFCGFEHVIPLEGGLKAWEAAGLAVVRGTAAPAPAPARTPGATPRPARTVLAASLVAFAALFLGFMLWNTGLFEGAPAAPPGEAHLENAHPPEEDP